MGVVYRDLWPEDVTITADGPSSSPPSGWPGRPRRIAAEGMIVGRVFYLPPEQALAREKSD